MSGRLLDRVQILRHHDELHDVVCARAADTVLELVDRLLQAVDDGLALAGDSHAGEVFRSGEVFPSPS